MKGTEGILGSPIQWLGILCVVALLSSCASKPEKRIVGKWKEIGGTETMEFFKNGTVHVMDNGLNLEGSYKIVGGGKIKFELRGLGPLAGPVIEKLSFSGGRLIFKMPDGKESSYAKVN